MRNTKSIEMTMSGRKYQRVGTTDDVGNGAYTATVAHRFHGKLLRAVFGAVCDTTEKPRLMFKLSDVIIDNQNKMTGYTEDTGVLNISRFLERHAESLDDFIIVPRDISLALRQVTKRQGSHHIYSSWNKRCNRFMANKTTIVLRHGLFDKSEDAHFYGLGYLLNYLINNVHRVSLPNQKGYMRMITYITTKLENREIWNPTLSSMATIEDRINQDKK